MNSENIKGGAVLDEKRNFTFNVCWLLGKYRAINQSKSIRVFHIHTKLVILALFPTPYCHMYASRELCKSVETFNTLYEKYKIHNNS